LEDNPHWLLNLSVIHVYSVILLVLSYQKAL